MICKSGKLKNAYDCTMERSLSCGYQGIVVDVVKDPHRKKPFSQINWTDPSFLVQSVCR